MTDMKDHLYAALTAVSLVLAASVTFCNEAHPATYGTYAVMYGSAICDNADHYVTLTSALVGAGQMPQSSYTITAVNMAAQGDDPTSYAVLGVQGGQGDWISAMQIGSGSTPFTLPAGGYYMYQPGWYLHLHYSCGTGKWMIPIVNVFYTY